jgi:hypothetical protein
MELDGKKVMKPVEPMLHGIACREVERWNANNASTQKKWI